MTKQEALSLLSIEFSDTSSLQECYESLLFDSKQFFSRQAIVSKVFLARLRKDMLKSEAFEVLGISRQSTSETSWMVPWKEKSVISIVRIYYEFRSVLQLELRSVATFEALSNTVHKMLILQRAYLQEWPAFNGEITDVIVGSEPDPVVFWRALIDLPNSGDLPFTSLSFDAIKNNEVFVKEWKRISLLAQKEKEWMMS